MLLQDFNIKTATYYFKSVLDQSGGNVLQAMGMYNGWQPGMTIVSIPRIIRRKIHALSFRPLRPPPPVALVADVRTTSISEPFPLASLRQ